MTATTAVREAVRKVREQKTTAKGTIATALLLLLSSLRWPNAALVARITVIVNASFLPHQHRSTTLTFDGCLALTSAIADDRALKPRRAISAELRPSRRRWRYALTVVVCS